MADRAHRNLQRLMSQARIGRFKPMADFDWNWPKKIDRELIERALTLDFISEGRNLILLGANGLGKTMMAKNISYKAVTVAPHQNCWRIWSATRHNCVGASSTTTLKRGCWSLTRSAISPMTPAPPTCSTK